MGMMWKQHGVNLRVTFKEVAEVVCGRKKVRKEKRTAWWSKEVEVAVKARRRHIRGGYK